MIASAEYEKAWKAGYIAAAEVSDDERARTVQFYRQQLLDPEDAAALAILEALFEEFAGEAIPYVWTHPSGFWGLPVLTAGLLTEEDRWIFTRVTRIFALDAVNPGAIAAEDLRRAFDSRHAVDALA